MKLSSASLADADLRMQICLRALRRQVLTSVHAANLHTTQRVRADNALAGEPHSDCTGFYLALGSVFHSTTVLVCGHITDSF